MSSDTPVTYLVGDIYLGKSEEDNPLFKGENPEEIRRSVVFSGENNTFLFRSNMSGIFYNDSYFVEEDGKKVYYPEYNEVSAEFRHSIDLSELELAATDVYLKCIVTHNNLFIVSQNDITAYTPNYLVVEDEVYKIENSLLMSADVSDSVETYDSFLGIDTAGSVKLENVLTGTVGYVDRSKIEELIDNESPNGALKVGEGSSILQQIVNQIRNGS